MVVAKMKGEEGTTVTLTVYRSSEDAYLNFDIVRAVVNVPTISYKMLENQIGYIQLTEFDTITIEQFDLALKDLMNQGAKRLIFDLRDNGGGLLSSVCDILDILLPESLLVYTEDKNGKRSEQWADDAACVDVPMVVLVNGNTASASEIFAGALRDYDKAEIIGTTSFGKGIVQTFLSLSDGSAVKLTTSEYFTPRGVAIHKKGVEPDIVIEYDPAAETDNQLQAAVDYLNEQ
jgi:carboxyl-terminal processing protease